MEKQQGQAMIKIKANLIPCLVGSLIVAGCTLGPNFQQPHSPKVKRYTTEALPSHTQSAHTPGGKTQFFVNGQDIPAEWWKVFHSKPLNQLIQSALEANPDLRAADAALRIAQETALSQRAIFYPRADSSLNVTRQETAHTLTPIVATNAFYYSLYTPQLTISYVPDVFGLNRRLVEALEAEVETAIYQREAIFLTISSNLVMAVIQEASLRAQIKAIERTIAIAKRQLKMLREEHDLGEIGLEGVAAQEALLAQTKASLPPLQKQLAQQHHLIAVLCGHFPSDKLLPKFDLNSLTLPKNLPLSLPAFLVRQRPDIRAAEAQAHAASARVGVATAQRLPNIQLTALAGSAALAWTTLLTAHTNFWALTANITQPVFDAGLLLHRQRAAVADYQQACNQYRSVLLAAFQNVADTLKAIQFDATNLKAAKQAVEATQKSLSIAQQQWEAGAVGYLAVLAAEQAYQQSLVNLAQSQANRLIDTAALFQALGGGWWNRRIVQGKIVVAQKEK